MIPPEHLHVELIPIHRHGGQYVSRTPTRIRVTHIPTTTVVELDVGSQHRSRSLAIAMLEELLTNPLFR